MSTLIGTKINKLLASHPQGTVMLSSWLAEQGYSYDLQQRYKKSKWLQTIGVGAMTRINETVGYEGAVHALQQQSHLSVHPGARTALATLGKAHYLELNRKKVVLFGHRNEKLPSWFKKYNWGVKMAYHQTNFLPKDLGLTEVEIKNFSIKVSGAARAIMECLYLAPNYQDLLECFELMEGLNGLVPKQVQILLENCESIKVKRLFLYLAEKANHSWVDYLDMKNIDLGKGKRSIVQQGKYVHKYGITVPKEWENNGKSV